MAHLKTMFDLIQFPYNVLQDFDTRFEVVNVLVPSSLH